MQLAPNRPFAFYRNDSTHWLDDWTRCGRSKVSVSGMPRVWISAPCNHMHLQMYFPSLFPIYFPHSLHIAMHCVFRFEIFHKLNVLILSSLFHLQSERYFSYNLFLLQKVKSMREEFPLDLHFALTRSWAPIKWERKVFRRSPAGAARSGVFSDFSVIDILWKSTCSTLFSNNPLKSGCWLLLGSQACWALYKDLFWPKQLKVVSRFLLVCEFEKGLVVPHAW